MAKPSKPEKRKTVGAIDLSKAAKRQSSLSARPSTKASAKTDSSDASKDESHSRVHTRTPHKIEERRTPKIPVIGFFFFLIAGALIIILDYLPAGLPNSAGSGNGTWGNWYLGGGLGLITIAFLFGTKIK